MDAAADLFRLSFTSWWATLPQRLRATDGSCAASEVTSAWGSEVFSFADLSNATGPFPMSAWITNWWIALSHRESVSGKLVWVGIWVWFGPTNSVG